MVSFNSLMNQAFLFLAHLCKMLVALDQKHFVFVNRNIWSCSKASYTSLSIVDDFLGGLQAILI